MKKRSFAMLAAALTLLIFVNTALVGCSSISSGTYDPSTPSNSSDTTEEKEEETTLEPLATPVLTAIGNAIYWESIVDADEYEIYSGNSLYATTKETYCLVNDLEATTSFYVVAKGMNGTRTSDNSEQVVVYKNKNFTETESIEITLADEEGYTIPSNAMYVKIQGSATDAFVLVADRSSDLVIELDNVTLTSPMGKNCISTLDGVYDNTVKRYSVTVRVTGENVLNGSNYTSVPATPSENSGAKGTKGGAGGSCIVLPNISFVGAGSLTLTGGNGGQGGRGASSGFWSTASFGNGGDGGNGGNGISCTELVMAMDVNGFVKTYGGKCGKGGKPGDNGSIVTGPVASIAGSWNNSWGYDGSQGNAYIGNLKLFGGALVDS